MNLVKLSKEKDTIELARRIAKSAEIGDVILLKGELGIGKTFFARNFIKFFYHNQDVTVNSPTFNLVQTYKTNLFTIWHFDLYRLKSKEEIFELGIEQAFDEGIALIEWPELVEDMLLDNVLEINFSFSEDFADRYANIFLKGKWKNKF